MMQHTIFTTCTFEFKQCILYLLCTARPYQAGKRNQTQGTHKRDTATLSVAFAAVTKFAA